MSTEVKMELAEFVNKLKNLSDEEKIKHSFELIDNCRQKEYAPNWLIGYFAATDYKGSISIEKREVFINELMKKYPYVEKE